MTALCEGWDDYVMLRGGAAEPLWAVMSRVLDGAEIPVAAQALALLIERVAAIATEGRLAATIGRCRSRMGVCECRIPASRHGPAPEDGAADFGGP